MPHATRILSAAILLTATLPCVASPASFPDRTAWHRFEAVAGAGGPALWSPVDDVPVSVRAVEARPLPGFTVDHAGAVRAMFRDHADLFRLRLDTDDFHSCGEREHDGIHHLRMNQTFRGIPVRGGQYMVSVGTDGRLRMIGGRSVPDVDADVHPVFTRERAMTVATSSLHLRSVESQATASLAIEPVDGPDHLVWQVVLGPPGRTAEWEVLVDAHDGTIVGSRSRAFGASGCAAVFDPSPLFPAHDDDFAISDPTAGDSARLQGPNVRVLHETAPEIASASLVGGCWDFHFDPVTQPESFDQVNVYRQVDHFIREFHGGNGFPGLPTPMTVILRPYRCGDPNTGETIGQTVWLTSEGCGYKSSTRDADIICHETQHAINNFFGLESGLDLDREIYATALHESFANYFSCAAHGDPVYAEYFFGPQGFANCNSDPAEYHYSRRFELGVGQLQNYQVGMIWSGALWDIRKRIGPIIDRIALESLDYLPSAPSMHIAVDAVLQADRDLHQGQYQAAMIAAFAGRGLGPGVPQVAIVGPTTVAFGTRATWSASVCCEAGPVTYQWSRVPEGSSDAVPMGADSSLTFAPDGNSQLRLRVVDGAGHVVLSTLDFTLQSSADFTVRIDGPTQVMGALPSTWYARVSGQGAAPVTYRWRRAVGSIYYTIGDAESLTITLVGKTTLQVLVGIPGKSASASINVVFVDVPTARIEAPADTLAPGASMTLWAAAGGSAPFLYRWYRNGLTASDGIGFNQSLLFTGDAHESDIYLVVLDIKGTPSAPAKLTISPAGIPLVAAIQGPEQLSSGSVGSWYAQFPDGTPPTTSYLWTRKCARSECVPETLGTGWMVSFTARENFDLALVVKAGQRTTTTHRQVLVRMVPGQSAAIPGQPGTFSIDQAVARDGVPIRFTLAGNANASASLRLLDISGREVETIFTGRLPAGSVTVPWAARRLKSGVYLAVARIGEQAITRRVTVVH